MIKPLTSFRFIAALAVFGSHLFILQSFEQTKWLFDRILYEGYLGVTFFFILSGFILTYNYYDKIKSLDKSMIKKFYKARIFRIYPVYILTFLISIPIALYNYAEIPLKALVMAIINLGMFQSFVPIKSVYFSFNAPSWSISDEMFFYVIFPFLIYFLIKIGIHNKLKNWFILSIFIYFTALVLVWFMRDSALAHWLFYVFPVFRFIDFFFGIILAITFIKFKDIQLNSKIFSILEVVSILLLVIAFYYFPHIHPTLRLWGYYLPFMALIIWIFAFQKGIISKLLSNKLLIYLGEISFSFYMIHQLIIIYLTKVTLISQSPVMFVIVALLLSIIASHIIYKYYEIPLKNKLNNKSLKTNKIKTPVSP